MTPAELARVLRAAADEAERIAAEQSADRAGWIDQTRTLLGARRHCRIVRARVQRGDPGAAIVRRRHLLSRAAHDEELALLSRLGPGPRDDGESFGARLRAELGIVRGP